MDDQSYCRNCSSDVDKDVKAFNETVFSSEANWMIAIDNVIHYTGC